MGRPKGTNNRMRTPEEKVKLIIEFMSSNTNRTLFCKEKNISRRLFTIWCLKYEKDGIEGLTSQTGRKNGTNKGRPKKAKTREEELERENLKLRIEKENYYVIKSNQIYGNFIKRYFCSICGS